MARTDNDTFDLGYYVGCTRTIVTSLTIANTAIGDAVGFYADVRGTGIRGEMDNLAIQAIPEPALGALLGLGTLGLLARIRRK